MIGNVYKIDDRYPTIAYCFRLTSIENSANIFNDIHRLICFFNDIVIPHNLFWTFSVQDSEEAELRIFVYPREQMCAKPNKAVNVAGCELSGYFVVGSESCYSSLTISVAIS